MRTTFSLPGFSKRLPGVLLATSLILLAGCNTIQVKLGLKMRIDKVPIATIEATLPNGPAMAPGEKAPIIATLTEPTGVVLTSEGKGKGKVLWADLLVTPTIVTVNKKGVLSLPADPRISDGKTGHVVITIPSHPGVQTAFDVPTRYDYPFAARYSGARGANGFDGTDGTSGIGGSPGSTDPSNPSAGGDGGNGGNGTDGGNGSDGDDGPAVTAQITLRAGSHPLLQAAVNAPGHKTHYYLVDPAGGTLTISSTGGSGGTAGKGGRGGQGGSGGVGTPNGNSGSNGSDGQDGRAGSDGSGGTIAVTYDPSVQPYLASIRTVNPGGPKPTFTQAPVAALW